MADTATCGATSTLRNNNNTILHLNNNNNNSPNATNNNPPFNKQRKRKRLSQVVDKLTTQVGKSSPPSTPPPSSAALLNNNFHKKNQNHVVKQELLDDDSCSHEGVTHPTSEPYMFEQKIKGVLASPSDGEPDDDSEVQASKKPSPNTLLIHHHPPEASMAPSGDATMMTALNRGSPPTRVKSEVFRFDSVDRDRYHYGAISEEEDVFSPASRSPHSSAGGSPHVRAPTDSPKVAFSPMRIKDASMEEEKHHEHGPSQPRYPGCSCAHCSPLEVSPMDRFFPGGIGGVPASPVSPLTPCTPGGALPISPSPINSFEHYLHSKYLPDIFRRRSHSDSDIPLWFEGAALSIKSEATTATTNTTPSSSASNRAPRHNKSVPHPLTLPSKGGSLESENSTPQDSPLDLSVRGSRGSSTSSSIESPYASRLSQHSLLRAPTPATPPTPPQPAVTPGSDSPAPSPSVTATTSFLPRSLVPVPVVRGDVASPTTKESVAHRYNLEVSPVVEEMPPGSDVAYVCPVCGQMFSLHDRLAKHMASRHKSKQQSEQTTKAYLCDVCQRSFARSDMLTRHMRLHTGVKPYTCRVCGQVFSRSDHLSTHQRTHTGEKPYRCPQCPYAACRRDMITRHMRTHARYEAGGERGGSLGGSMDEGSGGGSDSPRGMTCPTPDPPPPLSPSQALSSLSVHSPSPASPPEPMEND